MPLPIRGNAAWQSWLLVHPRHIETTPHEAADDPSGEQDAAWGNLGPLVALFGAATVSLHELSGKAGPKSFGGRRRPNEDSQHALEALTVGVNLCRLDHLSPLGGKRHAQRIAGRRRAPVRRESAC